MVIFSMQMNVLPQKRLELVQTVSSLLGKVQKETGCLTSMFCQHVKEENRFHIFERWRSQEDFFLHLRSDGFGILLGAMSLLKEQPNIEFYTVISTSSGIESVEAVRRDMVS